jgi:hypothetical protein
VSRLVLASFASAVLGALLGAGAVVWWLAPGAAEPVASGVPDANARAAPAPETADLERRLAAVEHVVSTFASRVRAAPRAASPEPPAPDPAGSMPHPVDTPVFEAAVIDILERAEEGRAEERAAAKDEKRRQKARHWANELSSRLGLAPAQTERLLEIHDDLDDELERERARTSAPDAPNISKEQRRAARQSAREAAERRLRALLAPHQLEAYDALDERLKLYRPKDTD